VKKLLFIGEHPLGTSGNSGMMHSILSCVDAEKYEIGLFAFESHPVDPAKIATRPFPFPIIYATQEIDKYGHAKLCQLVERFEYDAIIMVGIDLWQYSRIMDRLKAALDRRGAAWVSIFPYDIQYVKKDWVDWIKHFTHPYVYSKYGEQLLKEAVPNIRYFRPPLQLSDVWEEYDKEKRLKIRREVFPPVHDDTFVFGFVGANQVRKDPQKVLKAFRMLKDRVDFDIRLYLHTQLQSKYDLKQFATDCGLEGKDLIARPPSSYFNIGGMVDIYNSIDCLVNASLQEGLSWTLIEAMLCGTPFIATKTTAQIELLENAGYGVDCEELTYMPLVGKDGPADLEAKCCKAEDLCQAMYDVATNSILREDLKVAGLKVGKEWLEGVSDINELMEDVFKEEVIDISVEDAVLFAQHSSAGDVLMTTQCFKGIKEKHPNLPLIYMTQKIYMDIIQGNPYIDEIIDWDDRHLRQTYKVVYNPHGERILPGRFNTLATKLYDMYPYFTKVEPDEMFIVKNVPEKYAQLITDSEPFIVVHTTGGVASRTYKHMDTVISGIDTHKVIQIGGHTDFICRKADVNLMGKLSWSETAYVMALADAAVVIDSYPAHLAGAVHTPAVTLFGPAPARVTGPRSDKAPTVFLEPNHLDVCPEMGFCYGNVCQSPCINTISPLKVKKALKELLFQSESESEQMRRAVG